MSLTRYRRRGAVGRDESAAAAETLAYLDPILPASIVVNLPPSPGTAVCPPCTLTTEWMCSNILNLIAVMYIDKQPEIAMLGFSLPDGEGAQLLALIREFEIRVAVAVLIGACSECDLAQCMEA